MDEKQKNLIEVDLLDFGGVLLRKLPVLIVAGVIVALAAWIGTRLWITPQYTSTTKMYVLAKQDSATLTNNDMQTSTMLTKDYTEIVKTRTVVESVITQLDLKVRYEQLLSRISVYTPDDTRMIYITVTDEDPYLAADIADAVREAAAIHIQQVMKIEAVNVADEANIPDRPSYPNEKKNGLIAGGIGVSAAFFIILIWYLTDDTVKTAADIEKYLCISTLGVLPIESENGSDGKAATKKGRHRREKENDCGNGKYQKKKA